MVNQQLINPQDVADAVSDLSLVSGTPQERFFQSLVDYFIQWSAANAPSIIAGQVKNSQALLVIYSESPRLEPRLPAELCKNPEDVFPSLYTLDDGVAVANVSLAEVYQHVPSFSKGASDAMKFIRSHLSADQTFALLMMGQNRVLVHDQGVPIDEWIKVPREIKVQLIDGSAITPELIEQQLDEFHSEAMATHRGTIARLMWKIEEEPTLSILGERPELHVQSGLVTYFRGLYRQKVANIDEEISLTEGRVDVRVCRFDKFKERFFTMIELKVLDPRSSDTKNLDWARKGIQQAHDYKKTVQTDSAFACIFDARRDQSVLMPDLQTDADEKGVVLKLHSMAVPPPRKAKKAKPAPSNATPKRAKTAKAPKKV
ncbi:hypothetical protein [Diaphorobacter caeni]|uniref:hypothetical protein n=1 Tax=Diaphorobacter caeni TaxID=2784387 RepID=UPI00188E3C02|nr:hypothetical protein [Diaphorobacter caeni]MBF5004720.1 hypothetical protein [Diaphorobacter caeni]